MLLKHVITGLITKEKSMELVFISESQRKNIDYVIVMKVGMPEFNPDMLSEEDGKLLVAQRLTTLHSIFPSSNFSLGIMDDVFVSALKKNQF